MELKDIAAVSGKGGLFKVIKPTRTGVILETIDNSKRKIVANANSRVSILKEISIYTTTGENSILLERVFDTINKKYGNQLELSSKSTESELKSFIEEVVPDYDEERVYISDIKKLISWYNILGNYYPEVLTIQEDTEEKDTTSKTSTKEEVDASSEKETEKAD